MMTAGSMVQALSRFSGSGRGAAIASSLMALLLLFSPQPAAADAFQTLTGSWSGSGSASFTSGQRERLRCNANYVGGGQRLTIRLRCASSSAQINLSGALERSGNSVSGNWSESSFGYSGTAFGSATGSTVRLRIRGDLNGVLALRASGRSHTLALSSNTSTLTGVNVTMSRR